MRVDPFFAFVCALAALWHLAVIGLSVAAGVGVPPLNPLAERCFIASLYLLAAVVLMDRRGTQ